MKTNPLSTQRGSPTQRLADCVVLYATITAAVLTLEPIFGVSAFALLVQVYVLSSALAVGVYVWALRQPQWCPIEAAPSDREVLVYAPGRSGLPGIIRSTRYHPEAGFIIDELRIETHFMLLPVLPTWLDEQ